MKLSQGVKNDSEKPRIYLIPTEAITQEARVMTFGAVKYEAHNWRKGIDYSRCISAALRHILAFNNGEDLDPETKLSHLAHARCNLAFLLEFQSMPHKYKKFDDRYDYLKDDASPRTTNET